MQQWFYSIETYKKVINNLSYAFLGDILVLTSKQGAAMKDNNICKIPLSCVSSELSISCFVLETNPETMREKTILKYNRLILVEQGTGVFLFDGVPCPFTSGTLVFGFEGESFALDSGENIRYIYIDFGGSRGAMLCRRFGVCSHTRKYEELNGIIPFCKDSLLRTQPENVDIISESVLLYVFSRLAKSIPPQNGTIQKIIEFTEENFRDPELSLSTVASEIGYNPKYLSHFFKLKMNVSYGEYLRGIRFKYAISLFELGISSVKNVALLSGFSDPLYFSNAFKKAIGISPKEYISKITENERSS
jgi:AraC-like DNA-binding protein